VSDFAKAFWIGVALWGAILHFVPMTPLTDAIFWYAGVLGLGIAAVTLLVGCIILGWAFWAWADDFIKKAEFKDD